MAPSSTRTPCHKNLTHLPPELLDHVVTSLPSAQSVARLGRTSKLLHAFVEQNAWQVFARQRFPSLLPAETLQHPKDTVRSLTTVSRAWDRRAFVGRSIEPRDHIRVFPSGQKAEHWRKPRGQSIGFAPQIDCREEVGSTWRDRKEVLVFSAGAEICVRERTSHPRSRTDTKWSTYRPADAVEGRDDVTSLHLLRPQRDGNHAGEQIVTGTARGDLQLLHLTSDGLALSPRTTFVTDRQPIRATALLHSEDGGDLLAAACPDLRISLYRVTPDEETVTPSTSIDLKRPPDTGLTYRVWSSTFLSSSALAVGLGPSEESLHVYPLTPAGLSAEPLRRYCLHPEVDQPRLETQVPTSARKIKSSVYTTTPLKSGLGGSTDGQVFLSGAYDGVVRLHDLRCSAAAQQTYSDPIDDSAIYSLLTRGQEKVVVGTSQHGVLKVFDLRLGARAYSYLDATNGFHSAIDPDSADWTLFVKSHPVAHGGSNNNWSRRSRESSIYSLASPSAHSPFIYAGIEDAALELAFTGVVDRHLDPAFFATTLRDTGARDRRKPAHADIRYDLNLAMHDHTAEFKLYTQRSVQQTCHLFAPPRHRQERKGGEVQATAVPGLDERWHISDLIDSRS